MISKGCPKCKAQVAVACKSCPCGHIFFATRNRCRASDSLILASAGSSSDGQTAGQRRTERVKREKPKFYDSLQYENKLKKRRKPKAVQPVYEEINIKEEEEDEDSDGKIKKRRKLKKNQEERDDPMATLSTEKLHQCAIELAELNRKVFSVSWRV